MWVLFAVSIVSLAIIIERVVYFLIKEKKVSRRFKQQILEAVAEKEMQKAIKLCDLERNTVSDIIKEFIIRHKEEGDIHHFDQLVKEIAIEQIESLESRLYILGIIGYVSPMLGLLGTVTGMIHSFKSLAAEGVGDPAVVANGISQALFTTAAGLSIAIPAIVVYNFFNKKIEKVETDTEKMLTSIINIVRVN